MRWAFLIVTDDEIEDLFTLPGGTKPFCVSCVIGVAVTIHEMEPRSKRPDTWDEPNNRITICSFCHDRVHATGAMVMAPILRDSRERALLLTGKADKANELQERWEEALDSGGDL